MNDNCICPACEAAYDKKTAICSYLRRHHTGREKAVHSQELQQLFCIDGRNLRRKISSLRRDGNPICSNEHGYFYADTQQEINETVCRLNGLVTQISNARTGLLFASVFPAKVDVDITIHLKGGEDDG